MGHGPMALPLPMTALCVSQLKGTLTVKLARLIAEGVSLRNVHPVAWGLDAIFHVILCIAISTPTTLRRI